MANESSSVRLHTLSDASEVLLPLQNALGPSKPVPLHAAAMMVFLRLQTDRLDLLGNCYSQTGSEAFPMPLTSFAEVFFLNPTVHLSPHVLDFAGLLSVGRA